MREKILEKIYSISAEKGKLLLGIMAIITLVLGIFIPSLKISSSQNELIPADHPEQAKFIKFMQEFGAAQNLIVVLEGDTAALKSSVELFANEIGKEKKWVKSIFYRIDSSILTKQAPLFVPLDELKSGLNALSKRRDDIERIKRFNNLPVILNEITSASKNPEFAKNPDYIPYMIHGINAFFEEWIQWVRDPYRCRISLADNVFLPGSEAEMLFKSDGYLFSRDFKMLFLLIQPTSSDDEITYLKPFISDIRKACNGVLEKNPELKGKLKVAFTGMPAHVLTETETVYKDVGGAGIVSILLVTIILLAGFRSLKKMIVGVIPILSGLIITLGLISITVGRLNLISSSMLAVLFGIGIDFGIYLIQRTEEELGNGLDIKDAVHMSVVLTSKSIVTAGLTTSLAFFAIGFSRFIGYKELGITAGMGILVMLCTTFLIMPALLFIIKVEPRKYNIAGTIENEASPKRHRMMQFIVLTAGIVTALCIFSISKIKMDYNVLKMLPRDTESTSYQLKMEEASDFKMSSVMVTDKSLEGLKRITDKMKSLPTVSRIDSLASLIPDRQAEKIKVIARYREYLNNFSIPYIYKETSAAGYSEELKKLLPVFEDAQEKAFSGGRADLVEKLEKLIANINYLIDRLDGNGKDSALSRTTGFERQLFVEISKGTGLVSAWLNPALITEKSFSEKFINRFKSPQGTFVAYVNPRGSIWDVDFLDKFVGELKNISDNITGFPVTHRVFVRQAASAITEAMLYSFLMVIVLLFIDFRSVKIVALSLVPLCIGLAWLQGLLYALGITYNVANIAGLPLLLGLGVVYGVRIIHRWLEKPDSTAFIAAKTTGKGVFFAATATMIGLFSIVFARHNGVSSFGKILLFGLAMCLITALCVLPAILDLLYLKNKGDKNEKK